MGFISGIQSPDALHQTDSSALEAPGDIPVTAGLLACGSSYRGALPGSGDPVVMHPSLAAYSCGGSAGLGLRRTSRCSAKPHRLPSSGHRRTRAGPMPLQHPVPEDTGLAAGTS